MHPNHSTPPDVPQKHCSKCGEVKPATAEYFARDKNKRDGLQCRCKECDRAYRVANRERRRAYLAINREHTAEQQCAYRSAHPERVAEYIRIWKKANPDLVAASNRRRYARKLGAEGSHTAADVARQYERQRGRCYYADCDHCELGEDYHVDHIVPLSRGGPDYPDNLVLTCPRCNLRKNDRLPSEWPQGGRLL